MPLTKKNMAQKNLMPNHLSHQPIDRQSHRRRDADWIAAAYAGKDVRILPISADRVAVQADQAHLAFLTVGAVLPGTPVFLGIRGDTPHFALLMAEASPNLPFADLRQIGGLLPPEEASLAAYAVGLARWHERHKFCGVCGYPAAIVEAGHKRACTNPDCAAGHFPRTDPAVIVLVEQGDACFLARNARYKAGVHSTLAGFVEPGESLEAAVAREIFEEAAITLDGIFYHSSQPWPFPASLMVGFHATAASRDFMLDGEELIDGSWFTRDQLRPFLDNANATETFSLPNPLSISRRLIADWIAQKP